jgi:hypothetical protein
MDWTPKKEIDFLEKILNWKMYTVRERVQIMIINKEIFRSVTTTNDCYGLST